MRHISIKSLLMVAGFLPAWLALPAMAQAEPIYSYNPFSEGAYAYVAYLPNDGNHWIAWFPKSAYDCGHVRWVKIPGGEFPDSVHVYGGSYDDSLNEFRAPGTICGHTALPPDHDGHSLSLYGSAGNDLLRGFGHTLIYGHAGNDKIYHYRPAGEGFGFTVSGSTGDDRFCGCTGTNSEEEYLGGSGTDCVYDQNGSYDRVDSIETFGTCGCSC